MLLQIRKMLVIFFHCKEIYIVKLLKGRYKMYNMGVFYLNYYVIK